MAWTPKEDASKIYAGPYLIGVGPAGSEESLGDCEELRITSGYTWNEVMGGSFTGTDTLVDLVVKGVKARAAFLMVQTDPTGLKRGFSLATLSAGATSKSLVPTVALVVGKSMLAGATRIRFHKYSVTDLTDETQDIIFEKGVIIPVDEEWAADGTRSNAIPCIAVGFWNSTDGGPIKFGKNVA